MLHRGQSARTPRRIGLGERWEIWLDVQVGVGGFGSVFRARDKHAASAGRPVDCAAKRVSHSGEAERRAFATEIAVLQRVHDHESIISLLGEAHVDKEGWLLLEMATGGELFDRLIDCGSMTESARHPRERRRGEI